MISGNFTHPRFFHAAYLYSFAHFSSHIVTIASKKCDLRISGGFTIFHHGLWINSKILIICVKFYMRFYNFLVILDLLIRISEFERRRMNFVFWFSWTTGNCVFFVNSFPKRLSLSIWWSRGLLQRSKSFRVFELWRGIKTMIWVDSSSWFLIILYSCFWMSLRWTIREINWWFK